MARIIAAFTQFFDNAGNPLIDGKLQFLESGTNNADKNTFKDAALTPGMENTNPVILDGAGRLAFSVFGTGTYNVILFDSDDVQIQQFDPVGATTSGSQFSEWLATETYNKGDIVRATDGEYYQSFINDNNNNNPISNPATWDLITIVKSYIANASGTVDAITADFVPVMHSLADKTRVLVRSSGTNATTTPTFAPNGLTAKTIVKNGNQALAIDDISAAGHELDMAYNLANDNWELLNPSLISSLSTNNLLHIQDQKAAGTAGGTLTAGSFQTRVLNTELTNNIAGASLSANVITLPAGDYFIEALCPASQVNRHACRLFNTSDTVIAISGSNEFGSSGAGTMTDSTINGLITVVGTKNFEIQHNSQTTNTTNGFGLEMNSSFTVPHETYTDLKIWKVG